MNNVEIYTELHEGLPPDKLIPNQKIPALPKHPQELGHMEFIQYAKKIPDDKPSYLHEFASYAQPKIVKDENGKLWSMRGKYVTTTLGIEDRKRWQIQRETFPTSPKNLFDLGKLEKIGYNKQVGSHIEHGVYEFGANGPTVMHDDKGDLWFIGGNYKLKDGEKNSMRYATRYNPSGASTTEKAKAVVLSALEVGAAAAVTILGSDMAMSRLNRTATGAPRLSGYAAAGVQTAAGLVLATAIFIVGKSSKVAAAVSAGVGVGAVVGGVQRAYATYEIQKALAARPALVQTPALNPPAPGATSGVYASRGSYAMAR